MYNSDLCNVFVDIITNIAVLLMTAFVLHIVPKVLQRKTKCLRCVCDILNAVLHYAIDVRHFAFCVCSS